MATKKTTKKKRTAAKPKKTGWSKAIMRCHHISKRTGQCKAPSKGPRFRFMCDAHKEEGVGVIDFAKHKRARARAAKAVDLTKVVKARLKKSAPKKTAAKRRRSA